MHRRINRLDKMKRTITTALAVPALLWLQAVGFSLAATALLPRLGSLAGTAAAGVSQGDAPANQAAPAGSRAHSLSAEARSRILQVISAIGLILVRNDGDAVDRGPRPRGSAVVVRSDGVVATNYHVIARDKSVELYDELYLALPVDGRIAVSAPPPYRLQAVLVNREMDIALLKIVSALPNTTSGARVSLPSIKIGDSRALRELDDLVIIGYPEKGGTTVTVNSGLIEGKDVLENWIKTDARLIHGNSGGAAVDSEGRLIGIPTKVIVDRQPVDKDGDGFPDSYYALGAVGFLRPSHIVSTMLAQLGDPAALVQAGLTTAPRVAALPSQLTVSGVVRSARDGKPIAGAAVGLAPPGTRELSAKNILTWGHTDPDGRFQLNKPVPAGRYTLQAKTFGYEAFRRDVELDQDTAPLLIELRRPE